MQWILKNWFQLALVLALPLAAVIFSISNEAQVMHEKSIVKNDSKRTEFSIKPSPYLLPSAPGTYPTNAMCTLKLSSGVKFADNKLTMDSGVDENPITLTFTDLNTDKPSMIGNMGDKTPLTKINDGNLIYLIESTSFGNMNVFTLFRDSNIMLLSKQYDLLGMPYGLIMIGDCQTSSN